MVEREVSSGSSVHSSEEEYIGSSDDDEDFIVPAKYVRITTLAEIRAYRVRLPSVENSSEEVKLDPRLVSEHLVCSILPIYTSWFPGIYYFNILFQYLGSDMEFITQPCPPLTEGSTYELLALVQSGIVTFPEHILPLVLFSAPLITAMRSVISNLKVFAIIPSRPNSSTADHCLAQYGTTAEVYEYSVANASDPAFRIKTRVRQRFKVLHTWMDQHEYEFHSLEN